MVIDLLCSSNLHVHVLPVMCGRFQLLCRQPICLAFEPDNPMLDLNTDESGASIFNPRSSTSEFLLTPVRFRPFLPLIRWVASLYVRLLSTTSNCAIQVKVEFKWQPFKQKPDIVAVCRGRVSPVPSTDEN
eukprot:COSAG01_NODE_507_length_16108_cov_18.603973_19_plen_131_part_00